MEENNKNVAIEPAKYFEMVKEKKNQNTDEILNKFYEFCKTIDELRMQRSLL